MAFDPMQMMMLMQGMQGFTDNFSAARRGVQPPQQGGGMQEMVPMMAMMQRGQQQNQELEFQRQQFAAQQQAAQREQEMLMKAAPAYAERAGIPIEAAYAAMVGKGGPFAEALAKNMEDYTVGDIRFSGLDDSARARAFQKADLGAFDPLNGVTSIDPAVVAAKRLIARDGSTNITTRIDARNMGNAEAGMQEALFKERDALVGDIDSLQGEVGVLTQAADNALAHPEWFAPLAKERALAIKGRVALSSPFGGKATPEETDFISFVENMDEGKAEQTLRKVEKLTPVTEVEYQKQEDTAIGANSPIPRVIVKSLRAKKQLEYAMQKKRVIDELTHNMVQAARAGGPVYSPGKLQMAVEDWEKQNPFPMDSYVKELTALSKMYPMGGTSVPVPQPGAQAGGADADPLKLLGP